MRTALNVARVACCVVVAGCAATQPTTSSSGRGGDVRCYVTPPPHTYRFAKLCLRASSSFTLHEIQHVPDATLTRDCAGAVVYRAGQIELHPRSCQRYAVDQQRGRGGRPVAIQHPPITVQQTERGLRMPSVLDKTPLQLLPQP